LDTTDGYIRKWSPNNTQRSLTHQSDALVALLGVLNTLKSNLDSKFIHGLPEADFDASLLWSPVGWSIRRCDAKTMKALFPTPCRNGSLKACFSDQVNDLFYEIEKREEKLYPVRHERERFQRLY